MYFFWLGFAKLLPVPCHLGIIQSFHWILKTIGYSEIFILFKQYLSYIHKCWFLGMSLSMLNLSVHWAKRIQKNIRKSPHQLWPERDSLFTTDGRFLDFLIFYLSLYLPGHPWGLPWEWNQSRADAAQSKHSKPQQWKSTDKLKF